MAKNVFFMIFPTFHIPTPCSEDWDGMTPTACGRFCNVCQKEVIDLSVMDDATVAQTIAEKGNDLCARARKDQLAPPMTAVRSYSLAKLALFALALVSVFSGGLVTEVKAQVADSLIRMREDILQHNILKIKVLDITNQPVTGIKVTLVPMNPKGYRDTLKLEGVSDTLGNIIFTGLDTLHYAVDAESEIKNGRGLSGENMVFLQTPNAYHELVLIVKEVKVLEQLIEIYSGRIVEPIRWNYFDLQDLRRIPSR